jgi:hypothetical protein
VSVVSITIFQLASGVDPAVFVAADATCQSEFAYQQPGLLRRTTARADDDWLVLELWASIADAELADQAALGDSAAQACAALVDPSSVRCSRFSTLD